ncbi:MAG: guanylate kinase [Bacteroidota bacterium]
MTSPKLFAITAPSGGGKTSVIKVLLQRHPEIEFSVSATTREKRAGETEGKEYFYLRNEDFERLIAQGELVEHEYFFHAYYGTLKREVDRALQAGHSMIFDVDVKGALSIKKMYGDTAVLIFIKPPSTEILEQRLRNRKTESDEKIATRLERAAMETAVGEQFEHVVINDDLQSAIEQVDTIITHHLSHS